MREWILSFGLGVFIAGFTPQLPGYDYSFLLFLPALLSLRYRALKLPAAFCLGLFCLFYWGWAQQKTILPLELEQQDLWVRGIVIDFPQRQENSTRFSFRPVSLCKQTQISDCLSLRQSEKHKLLLHDYSYQNYLPGEHWLLKVRLKRPHGFANPGSFDYERWLFQEQFSATGYVRNDFSSVLLDSRRHWLLYPWLDSFRYQLQQKINQLPLAVPGYISALITGDRYQITDAQWSLLTTTGTNHLMVISGLHIGLVAWLMFNFSNFIFRNIAALCLIIAAPRLAALTALLAAFLYAGLAGFSLPVQRALVMVICLMSGQILLRQVSPVNSLALAFFIICLFDPLALQSTGFWLSFVAVGILLSTISASDKNDNRQALLYRIKALLWCQCYLLIGMLPIMVLFFGQISMLAPLINLLAIPFIGMLIVPLCLLALFAGLFSQSGFAFLLSFPDFLFSEIARLLERLFTTADFFIMEFPALPVWLWLILLCATILQFMYPRPVIKIAGMLILLICLAYSPRRPLENEFLLDILDVGQGLAVVVTTQTHQLVYDTGPAYNPGFNAGSGIIQPFFQHQNLKAPDIIVVSHGDNDHAGGLAALARYFPASTIYAGETSLLPAKLDNPPVMHQCLAGINWWWDQVKFEFLYPREYSLSGNNASCRLKISAGSYSALLTGDIEKEAELALLKNARNALQADIMTAPHHGSKTSSIAPFIRRVAPAHVVFSSGYLNSFGHPHDDVRQRYTELDSRLYDTSTSGALRFHLSAAQGIKSVTSHRQARRRLWHLD